MRNRFPFAAFASLLAGASAAACAPSGVDVPPPDSPAAQAFQPLDYQRAAELGPQPGDDPSDETVPLVQATGLRVQPNTTRSRPVAARPNTPLQLPHGRPLPRPGAWNAVSGFGAADTPAPTTGPVMDGPVLGHDPQVAVSDRFLVVYTAHRYQFFDKATGTPLADDPGGEVQSAGDFNTLFLPVWAARDHAGQPNPANINRRLKFKPGEPLDCDHESPTSSNACVQEFYDTRVLWDGLRKRFWVESAARNHLWFCKDSEPCDGPKQTRTQARRYIAIAVSKTEDPRQGFHHYILVDEYVDWPKIGLSERYLILGHRAGGSVYVFDADKLAAGNPDRGPVRVAKLDPRHFQGMKFIAPVNHHGPTNGVTYLLGSDGSDTVRPFALLNPDPSRAARPILVPGPPVKIGTRMGPLDGNAVFRNGALHWGFEQWAPDHVREYRQIRLFRSPARFVATPRGPRLFASEDPAHGYFDVTVGGREPDDAPGDVLDYEMPALDVNAAGDVVVVYARKGFKTAREVPPEVRYSIVYHGEQQARPGLLLRRGSTSALPDVHDNGKSGIDLAYAQVDPADDRTVWVTHAYADGRARWWRQVVAAVKP
jgi:hypothetical protein